MNIRILIGTLLAASITSCVVANKPLCVGLPGSKFSALNTECRTRTTEASCLNGFAIKTENVTASCIWHQNNNNKRTDRQRVYSTGGSMVLSPLSPKGIYCSTNLTVTLPKSSVGKWSMYYRLLNGPQNVSFPLPGSAPRIQFTTFGSTLGGSTLTSSVTQVMPKGHASDPHFMATAAAFDFYTSDKNVIQEWNQTGKLNPNSSLVFEYQTESERCAGFKKYPATTPAISDTYLFGSTPYQLIGNDSAVGYAFGQYMLRTFRAYRITNVTGVDWTVEVVKSLDPTNKKSKMQVMLMTEADYFLWVTRCPDKCPVPSTFAMRNLTCIEYSCIGSARGLGSQGTYRLLVSYPSTYSIDSQITYSNTDLVPNPYANQLVKTEITPHNWVLTSSTTHGRIAASSGNDSGVGASAPSPQGGVNDTTAYFSNANQSTSN